MVFPRHEKIRPLGRHRRVLLAARGDADGNALGIEHHAGGTEARAVNVIARRAVIALIRPHHQEVHPVERNGRFKIIIGHGACVHAELRAQHRVNGQRIRGVCEHRRRHLHAQAAALGAHRHFLGMAGGVHHRHQAHPHARRAAGIGEVMAGGRGAGIAEAGKFRLHHQRPVAGQCARHHPRHLHAVRPRLVVLHQAGSGIEQRLRGVAEHGPLGVRAPRRVERLPVARNRHRAEHGLRAWVRLRRRRHAQLPRLGWRWKPVG